MQHEQQIGGKKVICWLHKLPSSVGSCDVIGESVTGGWELENDQIGGENRIKIYPESLKNTLNFSSPWDLWPCTVS